MTPRLSIALNSPYFLSQSLAFIRISKDLSDSGPVILHASLATACPIAVLRDLTRIKLLTYEFVPILCISNLHNNPINNPVKCYNFCGHLQKGTRGGVVTSLKVTRLWSQKLK